MELENHFLCLFCIASVTTEEGATMAAILVPKCAGKNYAWARTLLLPVLLHHTGLQFCAHARPVGFRALIQSSPLHHVTSNQKRALQRAGRHTVALHHGLAEYSLVDPRESQWIQIHVIKEHVDSSSWMSTLPVLTSWRIKHPQVAFLAWRRTQLCSLVTKQTI